MLQITLDIATIVLLLCVSAAALVFHLRLARLRQSISEAGEVLPKLDRAVAQMNDASTGFSGRIQTEIQAVDIRMTAVKRLLSDMESRVRDADELTIKLENQLRQARKLDQARSRAVPRELAEPKGFAERVEQLAAAGTPAAIALSEPELDPEPIVLAPEPAVLAAEVPRVVLRDVLELPGRLGTTMADLAPADVAPRTVSRRLAAPPPTTPPIPHERVSLMAMVPFNSFATGRAD